MIKKLLLRQKNFSRLGKIKIAIGLAVLLLPAVLITSFSKAQTSGVIYRPSKLTSDSNITLSVSIQALDYSNGKWNYKVTWSRTLEKAGSIYLSPKVDRTATLSMTCASGGTNAQTGAADQIINSGGTIGRTGQCTAGFNPATRYRLEFYSEPAAGGKLLLRKFFNTLDQDGNPVSTEQIPATRGGTMGVSTGASGSTSTSTIVAISPDTAQNSSAPVALGQVVCTNMDKISPAQQETVRKNLGNVSTYVNPATFSDTPFDITTPSGKVTVRCRATTYKVDAPPGSLVLINDQLKSGKVLLTDRNYRITWDTTQKGPDGTTPTAMNVYLGRTSCYSPNTGPCRWATTQGVDSLPTVSRVLSQSVANLDAIMNKIPQWGNVLNLDIYGNRGANYFIPTKKGIIKVAGNVPFSQGYADFYLPDPDFIKYPGKKDGTFPDFGSLDVVALDSADRVLEDATALKNIFSLHDDAPNNASQYGGTPATTSGFRTPRFNKFSTWATFQYGAANTEAIKTLLMQMRDNSMGETGLSNSPEPLLVVNPGVCGSQYCGGAGSEEGDWQYKQYGSKEIWVYATVGRKFQGFVAFNENVHNDSETFPSFVGCDDPKIISIQVDAQMPSGLNFNKVCRKVTGGTIYADITGHPTAPGAYLVEFKTVTKFGDRTYEGKTRIRFIVKDTTEYGMSLTNYKADGSASTDPVIGGRSILRWDQHGLVVGAATFKDVDIWIAPASEAGKHPDDMSKTFIATVSDDVLLCNSSTSGGAITSTNPLAWGCSHFNWLVGNTIGQNLTPGNYVLVVTPHLPVDAKTGSGGEMGILGLLYANSTDGVVDPLSGPLTGVGGFGYGYGKIPITIKPGEAAALPNTTPGALCDGSELRRGITYTRYNSQGQMVSQDNVGFGGSASNETGGTVAGRSIYIQPGDSLKVEWESVNAQGNPCGTSWSSKIRLHGLANYENATAATARAATQGIVPGGIDFTEADGFMNSQKGSKTFSAADLAAISRLPATSGGISLDLLYQVNFGGCGNLTGGTNFDAYISNPNLSLNNLYTNCRLSVWMGSQLFVYFGGGNGEYGGCNLPATISGAACETIDASSYRVKFNALDGNVTPQTFSLYSGANRSEVENNCVSPSNCLNLGQVRYTFAKSASEVNAPFTVNASPGTYWNKLVAACGSEKREAVFSCTVASSGAVSNTANTDPFNTNTCRLPKQSDMASQLNGTSVSIYADANGNNELDGYNSFTLAFPDLRGPLDTTYSGSNAIYSGVQFLVGTTMQAVQSGCSSNAADNGGGTCVLNRTLSSANAGANRFDGQFTDRLTPNTTYYYRLIYTCSGVDGYRDYIGQAVTAGPGSF